MILLHSSLIVSRLSSGRIVLRKNSMTNVEKGSFTLRVLSLGLILKRMKAYKQPTS